MRRPQLVRQTFLVLVRMFASQISGGKFIELEQGLPPPFNKIENKILNKLRFFRKPRSDLLSVSIIVAFMNLHYILVYMFLS